MALRSAVSDINPTQAAFVVGGVLSGTLTLLSAVNGVGVVRVLLFAAFSLYLLGAGVPQINDRVPEYTRTAGIGLGVVGVVAAAVGTDSSLPVLFVVVGVGAYFRLF